MTTTFRPTPARIADAERISKLYAQPNAGPKHEHKIRALLRSHGIETDLFTAGALLSIAIDQYADHEHEGFVAFFAEMHRAAQAWYAQGNLCGNPRCQAGDLLNDGTTCRWCGWRKP